MKDPLKNRTISILILIGILVIMVAICCRKPMSVNDLQQTNKRVNTTEVNYNALSSLVDNKVAGLVKQDISLEQRYKGLTELVSMLLANSIEIKNQIKLHGELITQPDKLIEELQNKIISLENNLREHTHRETHPPKLVVEPVIEELQQTEINSLKAQLGTLETQLINLNQKVKELEARKPQTRIYYCYPKHYCR